MSGAQRAPAPSRPEPLRPAGSRPVLGLALGLVGVLVFGGSLPFTRLAVEGFEPAFVTAARPAGAGLIAGAVLLALRRPLPARGEWGRLALAAGTLVFGFPGLTNHAMRLVPASHGGVVLGALPLLTAVFGAVALRERPPLAFWIAAGLGAALVGLFTLGEGGGTFSAGDGLLALACVLCAAGYVASADLSARRPGWEVISWALVLALPVSLPLTLLTWPMDLAAVGRRAWIGFAYITLASQYLGFFAWNAGLALGGVAQVSQVQLVQVFATLAISALLLGEPVSPRAWGFAAAVVVLVAAASRLRRRGG